jgi:hypothetical protein
MFMIVFQSFLAQRTATKKHINMQAWLYLTQASPALCAALRRLGKLAIQHKFSEKHHLHL